MPDHIPSLAHLTSFVIRRGRKRAGLVRGQRRQVEAPRDERGFGYYYARMITAAIRFVSSGLSGLEIEETARSASVRQRPSYEAVAAGLAPALRALGPSRQRGSMSVRHTFPTIASHHGSATPATQLARRADGADVYPLRLRRTNGRIHSCHAARAQPLLPGARCTVP